MNADSNHPQLDITSRQVGRLVAIRGLGAEWVRARVGSETDLGQLAEAVSRAYGSAWPGADDYGIKAKHASNFDHPERSIQPPAAEHETRAAEEIVPRVTQFTQLVVPR
jgi:hypothetical protein